MKKVECITLTAKDDKQGVQQAFDQYLSKPSIEVAIKLTYHCARYMMVGTPVQQIDLEFDKLSVGVASYKDGKISISLKSLKKCKKPEHIVELLTSLFHEFSHALVDYNNNQIRLHQAKGGEFIPAHIDKYLFNMFKYITNNDLEMSALCSSYFYIVNKDEDMARKYSVEMTKKFLSEFCPDQNFVVKTHKQLNDRLWANFFEIYKDARYNPKLPYIILESYQKDFIKKLSNYVDTYQLQQFLYSIELNFTPKIRKTLIDYCLREHPVDQIEMILKNPLIKVTKTELDELKKVHGEFCIKKCIFGDFKIMDENAELSK